MKIKGISKGTHTRNGHTKLFNITELKHTFNLGCMISIWLWLVWLVTSCFWFNLIFLKKKCKSAKKLSLYTFFFHSLSGSKKQLVTSHTSHIDYYWYFGCMVNSYIYIKLKLKYFFIKFVRYQH